MAHGWNIGYGVLSDPKNRTRAEGVKREREWHEKAREFLARGIENIPNRYDLYFTMGWLYYEKLSKDCDKPPCQERSVKRPSTSAGSQLFRCAAVCRSLLPARSRECAKLWPRTKNGSACGS